MKKFVLISCLVLMTICGVVFSPLSLVAQDTIVNRTQHSQTTFLGDGKYALDLYMNSINYLDDKGIYQPIDLTIINGKVSKAPYLLEIYLTGLPSFKITYKQDSSEYLISLKECRISENNSTKVIPNIKSKAFVSGNKVIWSDYFDGVDVIITATNDGAMLQRIIKKPTSPLVYEILINEIKKGLLKVLPIQPAFDSINQLIKMNEVYNINGRTEILKLEVISKQPKNIVYPITDATDVQVGFSADDGYVTPEWPYWRIGLYNACGEEDTGIYCDYSRFTGISNVSGKNILVAYESLYYFWDSGIPKRKIYLEHEDSPTQVTSNTDYFNRNLTNNSVEWNGQLSPGWNNSPSLVPLVQEVADAHSSIDTISIFHKNNGDLSGLDISCPASWDIGDHTKGSKLHIEFENKPSGIKFIPKIIFFP